MVPFRPKGGIKKSVLIEGKTNLSVSQIVKSLIHIKKPIEDQKNKGNGFFCFGGEKGLASDYIGNYVEKAENPYK